MKHNKKMQKLSQDRCCIVQGRRDRYEKENQ